MENYNYGPKCHELANGIVSNAFTNCVLDDYDSLKVWYKNCIEINDLDEIMKEHWRKIVHQQFKGNLKYSDIVKSDVAKYIQTEIEHVIESLQLTNEEVLGYFVDLSDDASLDYVEMLDFAYFKLRDHGVRLVLSDQEYIRFIEDYMFKYEESQLVSDSK